MSGSGEAIPVHTRPALFVKSPKELIPGTLTLSHTYLKWSPTDATQAQAISLSLKLITGEAHAIVMHHMQYPYETVGHLGESLESDARRDVHSTPREN